jgi:hypothetical protein
MQLYAQLKSVSLAHRQEGLTNQCLQVASLVQFALILDSLSHGLAKHIDVLNEDDYTKMASVSDLLIIKQITTDVSTVAIRQSNSALCVVGFLQNFDDCTYTTTLHQ